ncbi:autotransporter outer membrane beta-barrel domain-containing protein [Luteibacter rhizovicinus]|uniref:autotransporter family protein n=1 Tax=Luteibacter rhizovicinus TaxID=242606 RepID=UPI00140551A6|nr:autotransporter outer membrane beta-barrel domain-containing protein [Luteibacter rhizovicinus]
MAQSVALLLAPGVSVAEDEGLVVDGERAYLLAGAKVKGNGVHALHVLNGGRAFSTDLEFVAHGSQANGLRVLHDSSLALLQGGVVHTHGDVADGVLVGRDGPAPVAGRVELRSVDVHTWGNSSAGVKTLGGAQAWVYRSTIGTHGIGAYGLAVGAGSRAFAEDTVIHTLGDKAYAVDINGANASVELRDTTLVTEGNAAEGIYLLDGASASLANVTISTTGEFSYGINANSGTRNLILNGSRILTTGASATGLWAYMAGNVDIENSSIRTTGTGAHALHGQGGSKLHVFQSEIATEGEKSWAAAITEGSSLKLVGSTLISERYGAIVAIGASAIDATAGARITGGNGTLLSVGGTADAPLSVTMSDNVFASGDIVGRGAMPDRERVVLSLDKTSQWTGASRILDSLTLNHGSHWTMTNDSRVGNLRVDGSSIVFAPPVDGQFRTLRVDGDYVGNDAFLRMNVALAGDDALGDLFHVAGNTSGRTTIAVDNAGGVGGLTLRGIRLVGVDGTSAGEFVLGGRAVAGAYEYFLVKGDAQRAGDGDWYLRSTAPNDPGPDPEIGISPDPAIDPPVTPPPPYVWRPEAGTYPANQRAMTDIFQTSPHDLRGDVTAQGTWARMDHGHATYDAGDQLATTSNTWSLRIGRDLAHWERRGLGMAGVMLSTGQAHTSTYSHISGYASRGKVRGAALGVYATWYADPAAIEGFRVDAWTQYAHFSNSVEGSGLPRERYSAGTLDGSVETGYAWPVAASGTTTVFVEPQAQLTYTAIDGTPHREAQGTLVVFDHAAGMSSRIGMRIHARHILHNGTVIQPFLGWNWLYRQRSLDRMTFNGEDVATGAPGRRHAVTAGLEARLAGHWSVWTNVESSVGKSHYRSLGGTLGARYSW